MKMKEKKEKIEVRNRGSFSMYADVSLITKFSNGDKLYEVYNLYNQGKGEAHKYPQSFGPRCTRLLVPKRGTPRLVYSAININNKTYEIVPHGEVVNVNGFSFAVGAEPRAGDYKTIERFGNYVPGGGLVAHKARDPIPPNGEIAGTKDTSFTGTFTGRQYSTVYLLRA